MLCCDRIIRFHDQPIMQPGGREASGHVSTSRNDMPMNMQIVFADLQALTAQHTRIASHLANPPST